MAGEAYANGSYRILYSYIVLKAGFYISLVFRLASSIFMDAVQGMAFGFLALVARGLTFLGSIVLWQSERQLAGYLRDTDQTAAWGTHPVFL